MGARRSHAQKQELSVLVDFHLMFDWHLGRNQGLGCQQGSWWGRVHEWDLGCCSGHCWLLLLVFWSNGTGQFLVCQRGIDPEMVRCDMVVQVMWCGKCLVLPLGCVTLHESGTCTNVRFTAQRTNVYCVVCIQYF